MASQAYRDWLNAGKPYALIDPAEALRAAIAGHGITVWHYPNLSHLTAEPPEDHTPFSATGWPGSNARWKARGLDIMPREDARGNVTPAARKENADIARQLIRDRDAGHPGVMWIKFLNWTDEKGTCRQERWMDLQRPLARTTRSSSDAGHIHVSGRSDADTDKRAAGYDPVARMNGEVDMDMTTPVGWTQQYTSEGYDPDAPWLGGTFGQQLQHMREATFWTKKLALRTAGRMEAMTALLQQVIQTGGGNVDVAALMAHVDAKLEALAADNRDAVADLGEGGAAQVRGPQS